MADSEDQRVPASQSLSLGDTIVTVIARKNETASRFNIHEQLLEARSSVIRDALQPKTGRSKKRSFTLYGCDRDSFEIYRQYIYSDKIPCLKKSDDQNDCDEEWEILGNLWLVSKKLNDGAGMDAASNALLHLFQHEYSGIPPRSLISMVYIGTTAESPLRRLMVDMYCWGGTAAVVKNAGLPNLFYVDLCAALLREKEESDASANIPPGVSCCEYHVHEKGVECSSRKRKREESDDESEIGDEGNVGVGGLPNNSTSADPQQQPTTIQATLDGLVKKTRSNTNHTTSKTAVVDLDESESDSESDPSSLGALLPLNRWRNSLERHSAEHTRNTDIN